MTPGSGRSLARPPRDADALALLDGVPLTSSEAGYVEAARAEKTLRGSLSGCGSDAVPVPWKWDSAERPLPGGL